MNQKYQIILAVNFLIIFILTGLIAFWFPFQQNIEEHPSAPEIPCFYNFYADMTFEEAQNHCKSMGMKLPSLQLRQCLEIPKTYYDTYFWLDAMIFKNGSFFGDEMLRNKTEADFKYKKNKSAYYTMLDRSKSDMCVSSDRNWTLQYCGFREDRHHNGNTMMLDVCIEKFNGYHWNDTSWRPQNSRIAKNFGIKVIDWRNSYLSAENDDFWIEAIVGWNRENVKFNSSTPKCKASESAEFWGVKYRHNQVNGDEDKKELFDGLSKAKTICVNL